ncbi:MAG: M48 family metallopeptidase [Euryarchaeota archaeon]|nr:M48 family metallopeptidase [Euryarchaeota archaeon]
MKEIAFGYSKIQYEIRRGKRKKTVALVIQPNSSVVVLAPQFYSENRIKQIVLKRTPWIMKRQEKIRRLNADNPPKDYVSGETFPYLGRQYRLKILRSDDNENAPCKLIGGRFSIALNKRMEGKGVSGSVKEKLISWYRSRAEDKIPERTQEYAQLIGKQPAKILIRDQGKRWGSCSNSGILRFNWKIIMAPLSVLDHVIVHELCHLIIKNHSDKFWNTLGSIIPDYSKKRRWLKDHSYLLSYMLNCDKKL